MANPGTGLPYAEELLLEHLAARFQTGVIRLLDRAPVKADELGAGDGDGIDCALWIDDARASMNPPSAANANTGTIRYDELTTITVRIQAVTLAETNLTLRDVKARAELGLNEVIRVCSHHHDLKEYSGHNMLTLLIASWVRDAGRLANGRGWVARYTVELELRARITPTA